MISSPNLVDADGFAVYFNHVHNLDGIVCIIFTHELYEPIALMLLGNAVSRHVYIDWTTNTTNQESQSVKFAVTILSMTFVEDSLPTGPAWTNNSQSMFSDTNESSPPTYTVASKE